MTILRCSLIGTALFYLACTGPRLGREGDRKTARADSNASVDIGDRVCVPGAEFTRSKRSLIIATDRGCIACQVSNNLFAAFAGRAKREQIPIFIVDSSSDSERAGPSNTFGGTLLFARGKMSGIRRVPTMLLLNSRGVVTHMWNGLVQQGKEAEAANEFFDGRGDVTTPLKSIGLQEFASLERRNEQFQMVDVSNGGNRSSATPIRDEMPIPLRDLDVRGPNELNRNGLVILDCRVTATLDCEDAMLVLRRRGFRQIAGLMLGRLKQSPDCN